MQQTQIIIAEEEEEEGDAEPENTAEQIQATIDAVLKDPVSQCAVSSLTSQEDGTPFRMPLTTVLQLEDKVYAARLACSHLSLFNV